jgi:hypothetical protein
MGFWSDLGDGFTMPFKWVYNQADKRFNQIDKIADKAASGADNLLDILGGNSNFLVYAGIAIVAVLILPTVLNKVL